MALHFKLNHTPKLRTFIYHLYEYLRFIEFKIKAIFLDDPYNIENIIYVRPEKIIYEKDLQEYKWRFLLKFIKPLFYPLIKKNIQIINGDWDLKENLDLFNDHIKYKSYYQHFIEGIKWEETSYYRRETERYLDGKIRKEYKSIEDLDQKYIYLDNLYRKINCEGFKTQHEIIKSEGILTNYGRGVIVRKADDDITVAVGRNGEIIFLDGRHRLNIAKMLYIQNKDIKKIPVRVLVIHPDFLLNLEKKF